MTDTHDTDTRADRIAEVRAATAALRRAIELLDEHDAAAGERRSRVTRTAAADAFAAVLGTDGRKVITGSRLAAPAFARHLAWWTQAADGARQSAIAADWRVDHTTVHAGVRKVEDRLRDPVDAGRTRVYLAEGLRILGRPDLIPDVDSAGDSGDDPAASNS